MRVPKGRRVFECSPLVHEGYDLAGAIEDKGNRLIDGRDVPLGVGIRQLETHIPIYSTIVQAVLSRAIMQAPNP